MKKKIIIVSIALNSIFCMAQVNWESNPVGAVFAREGGDTPEGTFRMTDSGYEVFTIVSSDKTYQPASLYYGENDADRDKVDAIAPGGQIPTSMNCFVVKTPDGYVMFDTGLPSSKGGNTERRLISLNINPDEIKGIYLTHGHFDHIGGLLDDTGKAVFPNAAVYVSATEFAFISDSMGETAEQIRKAYNGRLVLFEPGEVLPGNILPVAAKGHTPGHTVYQLGRLLFVGDIVHGVALQLIDPTICAGYDADRAEAIRTRNAILSYAVENSLTVLGAHVPNNGVIF